MIKYSILIPVFNVELYLRECLDSVVTQDFPKNEYEIIITDDGSTDDSSSICDEFASKYDNIYVIHQDNQGLMMARRTGVINSKGKYLICIDSDDYVDKNLLKTVDSFVSEENPDFLMHGYFYTYKNIEKKCQITNMGKEVLDKKNFMQRFAKNSKFNSIVCKVVRREILANNIDEIYRKVNIAEDMLQTIYLTKFSDKIVLIDAVPYHYRIRGGSLIHKISFDKTINKLNTYDCVKRVIYEIFENQVTWTSSEKADIIGAFDARVINGVMEDIYRYNNSVKCVDNNQIEILISNEIMHEIGAKYIAENLPLYNRVRLKVLLKKQFKLLQIIDRILMQIQKIKEHYEGVEWYQ